MAGKKGKKSKPLMELSASESEGGQEVEETTKEQNDQPLQVYLPGVKLVEGEELEADPSAYILLHSLTTEWPCLTFDAVKELGGERDSMSFPQTAWVVTGTQADRHDRNSILLMRCSGLERTGGYSEEEEAERAESGEDAYKEPKIETLTLPHPGGCNRIRTWQKDHTLLVGSWSEDGNVRIYDLSQYGPSNGSSFATKKVKLQPVHIIKHTTEGFAIAWNQSGSIATGDCSGLIRLTDQTTISSIEFKGHSASIEDVQFSPSEPHVFASSSCDRTVRIWDSRSSSCIQCWSELHSIDINVLSINPLVPHLLSTGADDGGLKVWDMRAMRLPASSSPSSNMSSTSTCQPVANFNWHRQAITSLEWHPQDSSVLAASGADHQLTLWDLAVERDSDQLIADGGRVEDEVVDVPPQLLFIHQGQMDLKELHWHPQLSGTVISTAADGFNIFRTISV